MAVEKEKKVRRLPDSTGKGAKKKSQKRSQSSKGFQVNPMALRLGLAFGIAVLTVFLAFPMPEAYNLSLLLGDIASQDVKADRDLDVLDLSATEKRREEVRENTPIVFDLDDQAADVARQRVHRLFSRGRQILSAPQVTAPIFETYRSVAPPSWMELDELKTSFHSAFGLDPAGQTFLTLMKDQFSSRLERTIIGLIFTLLDEGIVAEKSVLLAHPPSGVVVRHIHSGQEDKVPDPGFFPSLEDAQNLVKEKLNTLSDDFSSQESEALGEISRSLLRPNLVVNQDETEVRRGRAEGEVSEIFFKVQRGEMIVREGERVNETARLKLEALAQRADQSWLPRAFGVLILVFLFLSISYGVPLKIFRSMRLRDRDVIFLAVWTVFNLLVAFAAFQVGDAMGHGWPGVTKETPLFLAPLASGGMLATIFVGPLPGAFFSFVISALAGTVFGGNLGLFIYCFSGAIVGLSGVVRARERSQITKTSLVVGLANMAVILALSLAEGPVTARNLLFNLGAGFMSGILSGILVTGLIPMFEMIFRYTTNIKLLELANLDRPILRELMVQAPGTYHHSVIVGAMVEAAAENIGANPLLAKVSAYYHDLGKMKKPLYFVENQFTGENKHEKLAPSMSSLILTSHVKDGVELARIHKLSPEIIDIIQQHHGTSLIAYFYQKAKNIRTEDQPEINIEDYRYSGPKPQTREAGLVMLADAVEAASRSLGEPTPARVQGLVQKLINNIFSDGQLDECELTLKDLHLIAKSFNKILTGIFHRRISYPEPATKDRTVNGSGPGKPSKEASDRSGQNRNERTEDLKRLGMS